MDKATEIVLRAIIANLAKQDGGHQFLLGLSQSLLGEIENALVGDPVTIGEVGRIAEFASNLRTHTSN